MLTPTIDVITNARDWLALEPAWNALVSRAGIDHPFCSFDWMRSWWESFGHGRTPHIVVAREGDEVVGIAPLMTSKGRLCGWPVRRLESMGNAHTPRFEFIIAPEAAGAREQLWNYVRGAQARHWDVVLLKQLPSNGETSADLSARAAAAKWRIGEWKSDESPYIALNGTWERYLDTLSRKHRANLRNRLNRLGKLGEVRMEVVSGGDDLEQALHDGFHIEGSGWKRDEGTAILCLEDVDAFYRRLAPRAAKAGILRLMFLKVGESRIAFAYILEQANKMYALKVGYDQSYSAYSPSKLLCYFTLQDAFERGVDEYEFLGARDDWKLEWTPRTRAHGWLYLFPNHWSSRLLYEAKFHWTPRLREWPILRTVRASVARMTTRQATAL